MDSNKVHLLEHLFVWKLVTFTPLHFRDKCHTLDSTTFPGWLSLLLTVAVFSFLKCDWPHVVFLTERNQSQYPLSTGTDMKAEIRHPGTLCNKNKQALPLSFKENSVTAMAGGERLNIISICYYN